MGQWLGWLLVSQLHMCRRALAARAGADGVLPCLLAGVPSIVIATDYRILELAEAMQIVHTDIFNPQLDPASFDLHKFVESVRPSFDSAAFDANRRRIAREYGELLATTRVKLHPGMAALIPG